MCVFDSTRSRFSTSLVPSGGLSPWTHWTVLSLSHGPPLPVHLCSSSLFSFVSLSLPESSKMCVRVCAVCVAFMSENKEVNS